MKLSYLFMFMMMVSTSAFAQLDLSEILSKGEVKKGKVCFDECKESKKFFGVAGPKEEGKEKKACVSCLTKYPEIYEMKKDFLDNGGYFLNIEDDSGSAKIRMGEACFDECSPKKEFYLVGKKGSPLDNNACVPCLKKHSDIYKFNHSLLIESEVKCEISADKQYAYCLGDTYKLDSSINSLDRSLEKHIQEGSSGKTSPNSKASQQ